MVGFAVDEQAVEIRINPSATHSDKQVFDGFIAMLSLKDFNNIYTLRFELLQNFLCSIFKLSEKSVLGIIDLQRGPSLYDC
jgi:hypothetical protein